MTRAELLKENAIRLVREHKAQCNDPECGISMHMVAELIKKAGIELSRSELSEFM